MQPTRGSNFLYEWVLFCVYFSGETLAWDLSYRRGSEAMNRNLHTQLSIGAELHNHLFRTYYVEIVAPHYPRIASTASEHREGTILSGPEKQIWNIKVLTNIELHQMSRSLRCKYCTHYVLKGNRMQLNLVESILHFSGILTTRCHPRMQYP